MAWWGVLLRKAEQLTITDQWLKPDVIQTFDNTKLKKQYFLSLYCLCCCNILLHDEGLGIVEDFWPNQLFQLSHLFSISPQRLYWKSCFVIFVAVWRQSVTGASQWQAVIIDQMRNVIVNVMGRLQSCAALGAHLEVVAH